MTAHSSDTKELGADERTDEESRSRARRAASTVASVNENGWVSVLLGGVLLARGARSYGGSGGRGRAIAQGLAGVALIAVGLRQRRSGSGEEPGGTSDEAAAHREQSTVLEQGETNPRGTSGEPDVEQQTDAGNVEFTDEQDLASGRQPGMEDEAGTEDPRSSGDDAEIDLSAASMADEASEATGPSSTQAQPAQTDDTEPERTSAADPEADTEGSGDDDEPDPDAGPGEATEEATSAESEDVVDEIVEDELDDEDREGVETEGGATVHTDTNESDSMDIDVDDVTDPDDDMNTEAEDDEAQSSSHLDDDPPDEADEEEE